MQFIVTSPGRSGDPPEKSLTGSDTGLFTGLVSSAAVEGLKCQHAQAEAEGISLVILTLIVQFLLLSVKPPVRCVSCSGQKSLNLKYLSFELSSTFVRYLIVTKITVSGEGHNRALSSQLFAIVRGTSSSVCSL